MQLHGPDNWFFGDVLGTIGNVFNTIFEFLQKVISTPAQPRPVPEIGWLGVLASSPGSPGPSPVFARRSWSPSRCCSSASSAYWSESMDLLLVTIIAVVVCFVLGLPTGILMARNKTVSTVITPVLDMMQTMPPFAYLHR